MKSLSEYPLAELKQIYLLLHAQLPSQPDLMDAQLLHDLQLHLQRQATQAGVDVSLHSQWSAWLNDPDN